MAEEETGFTFVDKRRTAVEAVAPAPEAAAPPESLMVASATETTADDDMDMTEAELADAQMNGTPGTYELIGYCINLLAQQAWLKLGLLADPQTGVAAPDLAEAKVAVDTVGDLAARLEAAPDSIVPADMRRDLRTLLNDLRLNYVSQKGTGA